MLEQTILYKKRVYCGQNGFCVTIKMGKSILEYEQDVANICERAENSNYASFVSLW